MKSLPQGHARRLSLFLHVVALRKTAQLKESVEPCPGPVCEKTRSVVYDSRGSCSISLCLFFLCLAAPSTKKRH